MNIANSELVREEYGVWPSFHDAEIMKMTFRRGDEPGMFSNLKVDLNLFNSKNINEGTAKFETIKAKDNVISIEFYDVNELRMNDFNYQNVIDELHIYKNKENYSVEFESIFGVQATFNCKNIAVVNMVAKNEYKS